MRGSHRLNIRKGVDVSGAEESVSAWRQVAEGSAALLYLFNVDELIRGNSGYGDRVRSDCQVLTRFLEQRSDEPKVALVGTHADLDPRYVSTTEGSKSLRYLNVVLAQSDLDHGRLTIGSALRDEPALVVGSLISKEQALDLVWRIFVQEFGW
jgi:hypothetical protein